MPHPVVHRDDETGMHAADAARRLDVLGRRLRLPVDDHEAEAIDVDAHREHVRREQDVDRIRSTCPLEERAVELLEPVCDVVAPRPAGELLPLEDPPLRPVAASSQHPEAGGDVVVDEADDAAQLPQGVEVTDQGHVRVGHVGGIVLELEPGSAEQWRSADKRV